MTPLPPLPLGTISTPLPTASVYYDNELVGLSHVLSLNTDSQFDVCLCIYVSSGMVLVGFQRDTVRFLGLYYSEVSETGRTNIIVMP